MRKAAFTLQIYHVMQFEGLFKLVLDLMSIIHIPGSLFEAINDTSIVPAKILYELASTEAISNFQKNRALFFLTQFIEYQSSSDDQIRRYSSQKVN